VPLKFPSESKFERRVVQKTFDDFHMHGPRREACARHTCVRVGYAHMVSRSACSGVEDGEPPLLDAAKPAAARRTEMRRCGQVL
jgi:hypothetical protein